MNNDTQNGLMSSTGPKQTTTIMAEMRKLLAPQSGPPASLEDRLAGLTEAQRSTVLQTARLVQMAMQTKIAVGDRSEGYYDLVRSMYRNLPHNMATLVAEVLDDTDPLSFVPQPKPKQSHSDIAAQVYNEYASAFGMGDSPKQTAIKEPQQQASTPETDNDNFLARLTQSESGGNSQAEITIADGRRFVGSLQFGEARLSDYQAATGKAFTQDEFQANEALQDEVAQWHFEDIDKSIEALGDAAKGFDRDGLRSVAHLGGIGGMKRFVQSGGAYNPADELGTSLQDYYQKFSNGGAT